MKKMTKRLVSIALCGLLMICTGVSCVSAQRTSKASKKLTQSQLATRAWSSFIGRFRATIRSRNEAALKEMITADFTSDFFTYAIDSNSSENRASFLQRLGKQNNKGWKELGEFVKTKRGELYRPDFNADKD